MESQETGSSTKTDRKTVERNRRNHMKILYSQLHSLIDHHPHQNSSSKEMLSQPDQLDEAAKYIQKLERKIEKMKEKREQLILGNQHKILSKNNITSNKTMEGGLRSPKLEINNVGSALQVTLIITKMDHHHHQSLFYEIIRVLHEEGIHEVVNANLTMVDDTVFQTIHSEVGEFGDGFGFERISRKLKKLVHEFCRH